MTVSLVRGQKVNFTKEYPSLKRLNIQLHWGTGKNIGSANSELELDASLFMLNNAGQCRDDQDMVFYGNTNGYNGAVLHEDKKQVGKLMQEGLAIDLEKLPANVEKMAVTLTIYEGGERRQSFAMVENISASVVDKQQGIEVCRFDLNVDFTVETAIVVCELYHKNGEWRFNAVGAGYQGGLVALCKSFGIDVTEEEKVITPDTPSAVIAQKTTPPPFPKMNLGNPMTRVSLPSAKPSAPMNLSLPSALGAKVTSSRPPVLLVCKCGAVVREGAKFCMGCKKPR